MKTWPNCDEPGGGGTVTVRLVVPLLLPLVPGIVPAAGPRPAPRPPPPPARVTSPPLLTVASVVSLDVQVTVSPVRTFPTESRGVAVSCSAAPTCTVAGFGVTVTENNAPGGGGGRSEERRVGKECRSRW